MVDKEKLEKQTSIFGLIHESNHDEDWRLKHDKIQTVYVSLLPVHNRVLEHEFKKYGNNFIDFYEKPNNKYESTKYYLDILENQINPTKPSFSWVYFLDPDDTGHSREYNSEEYYQALAKVDKEIGQIVNKLKE
ncbi:MAG: hypothetical protein E7Y34_03025, partial [Mycoplasma sp.]|nr:hypothetical protein [Mycoplasma sp.]